MARPTGIDDADKEKTSSITDPELVFLSVFGRRLNQDQITALSEATVIGDKVVPPFSALVTNEKYCKYLEKVKKWAFKRLSTQQVVDLLCDPLRDKTGWIANGGTTYHKGEWEWMNS